MPTKTNLSQFIAWAKEHKHMAERICAARAFAQIERKRVDAYIEPLFQTYQFKNDLMETGEPLKTYHDLYLSTEEDTVKAFYAKCDALHRLHGFDGPEGHCPALRAENALVRAENELLDAAGVLMDFDSRSLFGEDRKKMLELLMGACLK